MPRRFSVAAVSAVAVLFILTGCFGPTTDAAPESTLPDVADPLSLEQLATFSSVARLEMGSNCTGTLIDTGVPSGPGYLLTNGHCTGDVGRSAQGVTVAEEWFGTAEFFAAKGNDARLVVEAETLEYSTMRGRDLAIVRLDHTLGRLMQLGVQPVPIASSEPDEATDVVNIGAPVQDLPQDDWVLRRGDCTLGSQQNLIEFHWLWFDSWSNDCPGIIQGSSGSPLFAMADGAPTEIVAMINTTTGGSTAADGGACFLNRPCEIGDDGPRMVEDTSYAVTVAGVDRCFDAASGIFSLSEACPLETSDVWSTRGGGSFRGGGLPDANGGLSEVSFVGAYTDSDVRTTLAPLGTGDACLKEETYSDAASAILPLAGDPWDDGLMIAADLPEVEGHYVLCAVTGDDYAGAASVLFDVDRTPPIFAAGADVENTGEGRMVRPHLIPPEISTVRFTWGAEGRVDCDNTARFQDFFIVPLFIETAELPATYCVYGMDAAGNPTPVTTIEIPRR